MDKIIQAPDGRTISFADFGEDNQIALEIKKKYLRP